MICSKCGTKSPDHAGYCTNCGERFAKPRNDPGKADPALTKKQKLIAAAAAAVVLVIAIILVFAFSGNEAEKAAKGAYEAVADMDIEAAIGILPPAMVSYITESLDFADSDFRVTGSEELSKERVEEIDAVYGIQYGTKEGYIEAATVVYAEISYHGESLSKEAIPLVMVEIGGDWYLEPLSTAEELEKADFAYDISGFLP